MAKHRAGRIADRWLLTVVGVLAVVGLVLAGTLALREDPPPAGVGFAAAPTACDRSVRVVTATSFAPALAAAAPQLEQDGDCVKLDVITADGRAAVQKVAEVNADLWIPDDGSWVGSAGSLGLAEAPAGNAGTVLATSPFYLVADRATGAKLQQSGAGWLGLARLVEGGRTQLVVRDPLLSGDGMVAAGAVAEAVWLHTDMDASALWLARAKSKTRIVTDGSPALPARPGEVGVVPEYALLPTLDGPGSDLTAVPGADHTAMLRYTWLPLAAAAGDPVRAAALKRLHAELTGPAAAAYLKGANLRVPGASEAPDGSDGRLPPPKAKPLDLLKPHHVDHVFTTWYAGDRRTNLLVAVDVSGSMAAATPGSTASRIELVRQGCRSLAGLLPDDSRMGLWEFGSELDGKRDHRQLLGMADLDDGQRKSLSGAIDKLTAKKTGTGLYDTILAAYTSARDAYRPGVPNQVVIFTDGRNESDPGSPTAAQLAGRLRAAADPDRPVHLSVVTFGKAADAKVVEDAVKPVDGYVDVLTTADEVAAVFIHVAAGGLHHH